MKGEVAIVCSTADQASLNIASRLLELGNWIDHDGYKSWGHNRLIIHDQQQIALCGFSSRIDELGLKPSFVVFACKHKAKDEIPWLGGHFTGEIGSEDDDNKRLSIASPSGLRSFLCNISQATPKGFRVSAEATHHGPTDMTIPCFFAEIGSSEKQWSDPLPGEAVAKSILGLENQDIPVFLGIGGGHYVPRQSSLMLETEIAFGHMFSSYQLDALDTEILEEAKKKSGASYAYIDRKSLRSDNKNRISHMMEEIGLPLMRSKEIRARFSGAIKDEIQPCYPEK